MRYVLVYEEVGENNLETWSYYKTNVEDLPDKIDNEFIQQNFTLVVWSNSPFECKYDAYYERYEDDEFYTRVE